VKSAPAPIVLSRPEWQVAYDFSRSAATRLPVETVSLADAIGRVLAVDVRALTDLPHYASSAMDGWAVAGEPPWRLIDGSCLHDGEAVPIVTGGAIPDGTRGILRSEHGTVSAAHTPTLLRRNTFAAGDEPAPGQNVRRAGEEAHESEVVITAGKRLNPAHIAVAAVGGHDGLSVVRAPRVRILFTGDEVVQSGIPAAGYVRDTFGPQLSTFVRLLGGDVVEQARIGDQLRLLSSAIADNRSAADVVITTGGTGTSGADHVHSALESVGARILIDGVSVRPGGPTLLAELAENRFLVGLPGNPLAAMMGMLTLIRPLFDGLLGAESAAVKTVTTGHELPSGNGRTALVPYNLVSGAAVPAQWLGAGMMRGLADADGVLVCPPSGAQAGDAVISLPLPW
jgi:molybdopterin molybdotransferase